MTKQWSLFLRKHTGIYSNTPKLIPLNATYPFSAFRCQCQQLNNNTVAHGSCTTYVRVRRSKHDSVPCSCAGAPDQRWYKGHAPQKSVDGSSCEVNRSKFFAVYTLHLVVLTFSAIYGLFLGSPPSDQLNSNCSSVLP